MYVCTVCGATLSPYETGDMACRAVTRELIYHSIQEKAWKAVARASTGTSEWRSLEHERHRPADQIYCSNGDAEPPRAMAMGLGALGAALTAPSPLFNASNTLPSFMAATSAPFENTCETAILPSVSYR